MIESVVQNKTTVQAIGPRSAGSIWTSLCLQNSWGLVLIASFLSRHNLLVIWFSLVALNITHV